MYEIRDRINASRTQEVDKVLEEHIQSLKEEGYEVEFGKIGVRTTYALIYTADHEKEVVGYTFIKNTKFYKENVGQLRALQQAIARKEVGESRS